MGNLNARDEDKKGGKTQKIINEFHKVEKKTCGNCGIGLCKCIAILLSIAVIVLGIVEIGVCVTTAIATKLFSSDLSGRLVTFIVLAVLAAVALSVGMYAVVGLFKKKRKALHVAGVLLFIIAVVQALLTGLAVKVSPRDESVLVESLKESFRLAQAGNPRHMKLWALTNSDLQCCGLYGPEDYRSYNAGPVFPPDILISCCPSYNASKSDLVQEGEREACRANRSYYEVGCGGLVKNVLKNTATAVISVTSILIVAEVLLSLQVYIMYRKYKKRHSSNEETVENRTGEAGVSDPENVQS